MNKPTNTRQACAHQSGRAAARAGKEKKANPHRKGTVDRIWWDKGFDDGVAP